MTAGNGSMFLLVIFNTTDITLVTTTVYMFGKILHNLNLFNFALRVPAVTKKCLVQYTSLQTSLTLINHK